MRAASPGEGAPDRVRLEVAGPAQLLELGPLLRKRLLSLTLIELGGIGTFYVGRFFRLDFTRVVIWRTMVPGACYIIFIAVMVTLLWRTRTAVVRRLRALEGLIFALTTLFYMNEAYTTLFVDPGWIILYAERHPAEMSILARQTSILWLATIVAYGTFIPNTGRRCALVTSAMGFAGVAVAAIGGVVHQVPGHPLFLFLAESTMWMIISVAMAVYGSQKITTLREQALAARKLGHVPADSSPWERRHGRGLPR